MLTRRGVTLVELLVSMTLLGIVGAAATSALVQQTRLRTQVVTRGAAAVQLRGALAPLLADLDAISPSEGDIPAGEARDTSLELRATRGEGVVCAAANSELHVAMLSPARGRDAAPGDLAWWYARGSWQGEAVVDVQWPEVAPSGCAPWVGSDRRVLRLALGAPVEAAAGAPVRFTRRIRYSFYRAGDGETYLGLKEWSATLGTFSGLQPVAGPFDRRASRFLYHDTLGAELTGGTAIGPEIASVSVRLGAPMPGGALPARSLMTPETASVRVVLRNRR